MKFLLSRFEPQVPHADTMTASFSFNDSVLADCVFALQTSDDHMERERELKDRGDQVTAREGLTTTTMPKLKPRRNIASCFRVFILAPCNSDWHVIDVMIVLRSSTTPPSLQAQSNHTTELTSAPTSSMENSKDFALLTAVLDVSDVSIHTVSSCGLLWTS